MEDASERSSPPDRSRTRGLTLPVERTLKLIRTAWPCALVVVGVLLVVVPFGYAASGNYLQVVRGAGYGLVVGIGIALHTRRSDRAWLGLLVGSVVGMTTVQILAGLPPNLQGPARTLPTAMALTVALVDGFGEPRLQGYRDAIRQTCIVSFLFMGLAFVPGNSALFLAPWFLVPSTAVIAGFFSRTADGRRYVRPPVWLIVLTLLMMVLLGLLLMLEEEPAIRSAAQTVLVDTIAVPVAVFVCARGAAVWLHPRLMVYSQLAAYLRVMWVPIGGFAIGYLVIIVLFAGFYGMLAHFSPGAFTGVADDTGIMAWVSFAFFTGVGRDVTGIVPVSAGARALVGAQLIPSIGWALVVFAAVMAHVQPQLERIARRDAVRDGE